jgi:hypothetical protein
VRFARSSILICALVSSACNRAIPDGSEPSTVIESGDREAGAGLYSSVAVGEGGDIHVAYYNADLKCLRYATWSGKAWEKSTIDGNEKNDRGRQSHLVLDGEKVFIAYQDSTEKKVLLASKSGDGKWSTEIADPSSFRMGDFLDVTVVSGRPQIAFFESTNSDLMLAEKKEDGSWASTPVDRKGDVGRYVSMDSAFDGRVGMAYYDGTYGGLKYAERTAAGIEVTKIDGFSGGTSDAVGVGTWAKIRMQPRGNALPDAVRPKILYYDDTRHRLLLAERQGGAGAEWKKSVVDDEGYVGTDGSFVWLDDGTLVAVYFDATNNDLKLARRSEAGDWSRQTVLSQGGVGLYNAIDAVAGDKVAVTTYNLSRGQLNYLLLPVRP